MLKIKIWTILCVWSAPSIRSVSSWCASFAWLLIRVDGRCFHLKKAILCATQNFCLHSSALHIMRNAKNWTQKLPVTLFVLLNQRSIHLSYMWKTLNLKIFQSQAHLSYKRQVQHNFMHYMIQARVELAAKLPNISKHLTPFYYQEQCLFWIWHVAVTSWETEPDGMALEELQKERFKAFYDIQRTGAILQISFPGPFQASVISPAPYSSKPGVGEVPQEDYKGQCFSCSTSIWVWAKSS